MDPSQTGGSATQDAAASLSRISRELVAVMKRDFGRGPVSAKSYMIDDFLIVVMRGGLTTAERTLLDHERADAVRAFRQVFENEMSGVLTGIVEGLTGRKVVTYQSQVLFDPDIIVELFFFEEPASPEEIEATTRALVGGD
jgi:uncharacterized protein YbcI